MLRYLTIKNQLLEMLKNMSDGEFFSPRVELCRFLDTTSATLAKAFSELTEEGYVESIKGKGTFKLSYAKEINLRIDEKIENWGVITLDISTKQYSLVMKGISEEAQKYGVNLIFCNSNFDEKKQFEFINRMTYTNVDGLIIVPIINTDFNVNQKMYEVIKKAKVPFIFCHRGCSGVDAPIVKKNDFFGAYTQARYMIDQGCKNMLYVANVKYPISIERAQGFISAILEKNLPFDRKNVMLYANKSYSEIIDLVEKRLKEDDTIDGICGFCDRIAAESYKAINKVGKRVGEDIKVIGYDDTELCEVIEPKLTSVKFDSYNMGKCCAQMLYKMTHGYEMPDFDFFLQQPEIVVRQSCDENKID